MSKYYIAIHTFGDAVLDSIRYQKIEGKPVSIEGFEEFDLFIHLDHNDTGKWVLSEGKTGLRLFTASTQSYLKELAKKRLKEIGKDKLQSAIKAQGHTPRYDDRGELVK